MDILLEAQRSIMLRLTAIEVMIGDLVDVIALHEQATQKALRVLQAEINELQRVVLHIPAPRRCVYCACVVSTLASICDVCKKPL